MMARGALFAWILLVGSFVFANKVMNGWIGAIVAIFGTICFALAFRRMDRSAFGANGINFEYRGDRTTFCFRVSSPLLSICFTMTLLFVAIILRSMPVTDWYSLIAFSIIAIVPLAALAFVWEREMARQMPNENRKADVLSLMKNGGSLKDDIVTAPSRIADGDTIASESAELSVMSKSFVPEKGSFNSPRCAGDTTVNPNDTPVPVSSFETISGAGAKAQDDP